MDKKEEGGKSATTNGCHQDQGWRWSSKTPQPRVDVGGWMATGPSSYAVQGCDDPSWDRVFMLIGLGPGDHAPANVLPAP